VTDEMLIAPTLDHTTHTVTLEYRHAREEVAFVYRGFWGSEWGNSSPRVYCTIYAVREGPRYNGGEPRWRKWRTTMGTATYGLNGSPVDDTIRAQLHGLLADRVLALIADPEFYEPSVRRAYRRHLFGQLRKMTLESTGDVLCTANSYVHIGLLSPDDGKAVLEAVDAYETFWARLHALEKNP
jgi:hypothetical protein